MNIRLEKMIPLPMLEQQVSSSGIWKAESVVFQGGKTYLIEAPSGKGKTSLLSVVFGIRKDYQGNVFFEGENISGFSPKQWSVIRKEKLSFIFQGLELFSELTAFDNIQLKNSITHFKPESEIRDMADKLDIGSFLDRKAGILSFGQQQRVSIIRALCQPFQFLLADECFSHLDSRNSKVALGVIREECKKQDAGLILTSLNTMDESAIEERFEL
jgi:putative ABC transport system ATP-binding protein